MIIACTGFFWLVLASVVGRWRTFSVIAIARSSIGLGGLNAAVLLGFKRGSVRVVQVLWKNRHNGW
jgi:hypothetical protein